MTGPASGGNPTVHYSLSSRVLAAGWIVIAVLLLADLFLRGEGPEIWTYASILVVTVALVYLVWLRPRVVVTERGLRMINPLRETFVPWAAVQWVDVVDVLRVHTPDRIVRSWPLRETKRQRVRDNMRREGGFVDQADEGDPRELRPMDRAALQLRQDAERHKARPLPGPIRDIEEAGPAALGAEDRPQTMVSVEVIVVLGLTVTLIVAAFLLL
ncbi:PH domain-containing protein [Nocardiopsis sp. N85]|uniref:PH domain-containing protein n=1 Tax=Nocardiopsis sp. N85 TaxID=3029400 RepID=UPI00237FD143|nr:PH domain-containing protein [Nocardiopsis sp. N85]MDE3720543.1 PH domain-containing protein [Nocardiopsis sp. N85]